MHRCSLISSACLHHKPAMPHARAYTDAESPVSESALAYCQSAAGFDCKARSWASIAPLGTDLSLQLQLQWGPRPNFCAVCCAHNGDGSQSNYGVVTLSKKRVRSSAAKKFLDMPTGCHWVPLHRTVPVAHYIGWMQTQCMYQEWEAREDDMSYD